MAHVDAPTVAELRRRMQGSFSSGELRTLGATLGLAADPSWDRGPDALLRDLVRRALEQPGLHGLVEQLRRDKPLVEWDDLLPPARGGDTELALAGPEADAADLETQPTIVEAPALLDLTPPPFGLTPPPMPGVVEVGEPAGASSPGGATLASADPAAATVDAGAPAPSIRGVPPSAGAASWPLQNLASSSEPPKRGLEPRLVAITASCIALAVVAAFVGGIVWSRQRTAAERTAGTRSEGLAGQAATAVESALVDVARGCGLEVPKVLGRDVLRVAQTGCGHPVTLAGRPPPGFDPNAIEPPKLDGGPSTQRKAPTPGAGAPKAPVDPCRDTCKVERNSCKSACGDEPRDASAYEAWQGCNGKCLAAESKCRQACQ